MPKALPNYFTGPSAWKGEELQGRPDQWRRVLSVDEVAELEAAAETFISSGKSLGQISAQNFPLSTLSAALSALKQKLLNGVGFELISGLPIERYDRTTAAVIFCGVGAHLGRQRSQNAAGHCLGHVRDLGRSSDDPNTRIYQTSERQSFHTDSADVVGLLCLRNAKKGGDSLLVSVEAIYNRMKEERPDLLALLFDPLATDWRGEEPIGAQPFMTIPPLSWCSNVLTVFYQRQYIESAQRFPDAMRLTDAHREALDYFDALAEEPQMHLRMRLTPGDMQFVYNHSQLHDRTGFVDWPEADKRRHLLRLWLTVDGDRELPPSFKQRYGSITIGDRGGVASKDGHLRAPLD